MATRYRETAPVNAAVILMMDKIEQYEIASYARLHEWAMALGEQPAAKILKELLDQEQAFTSSLAACARTASNAEAMQMAV